jgi:hypothetical protein
MIIKYFDEFNGQYIDLTGTTGQGLEYGASGWIAAAKNPYRSFVGEISQSGESDPTITTFFNDTGATFTIIRDTTGTYRIDCSESIFVKTQMWWYIGNNQLTQDSFTYQALYLTSTQMQIYSYKNGTLSDDALEYTSFEFRQY